MPSFHAFIILSRGAKDGLEAPSDDEGIEKALERSTACAEADQMVRITLDS